MTKTVSRFSHGATGLFGWPDAQRRGDEIAFGLNQMAEECGTKLKGGLHIDANGEISIVCDDGHTYGDRFASMIKKHGARTGAIAYGYNMHTHGQDTWCRMNHFSVQSMLEDYFNL